MARAASNPFSLRRRIVSLSSARETHKLLRRVIPGNIDLVPVLEPNLQHVKVDPAQIQQILINLVVNARDAMPQGGKVVIETANVELDEEYAGRHIEVQPGHYVMLAVSDNGSGIDEPTQARIFEPFFTTKQEGKGTGLGLSTVYGIVRQSGRKSSYQFVTF
jgi:signal transduction histidine kinase